MYWVASGKPQQDREMEELLNSHAREIRHQLSALRLLGHTPPITFVRGEGGMWVGGWGMAMGLGGVKVGEKEGG